jgi:hypothetical protein
MIKKLRKDLIKSFIKLLFNKNEQKNFIKKFVLYHKEIKKLSPFDYLKEYKLYLDELKKECEKLNLTNKQKEIIWKSFNKSFKKAEEGV